MTRPDPWLTFGPDLLAGVISGFTTGLVVGGILLIVQRVSESRRARAADESTAYFSLLEHVAAMLHLDFANRDEARVFSTLRHRMMVLSELVDDREPAFPIWLEAERQEALHRALLAADRVQALSTNASVDEILEAGSVLYKWVAEFTNNLRFWRTKKLTAAQMKTQASAIEKHLRSKGDWHEGMEWRKGENLPS